MMKIVSWNCNGKFREKYHNIAELDADVYVIQECENPEKYTKQFGGFLKNWLWYGEKDSKGLAIFFKKEIKIEKNNWSCYCLRHFISVKIDNRYDLLGVWASEPYIEEYYIYQSINIDKYNKNTIIIGDFNSNAIWDKKHKTRNHSNVVKELRKIGLESCYHYRTNEVEGKETTPTFYMYRHTDKKYHIDYCFACQDIIKEFEILNFEKWLQLSDHMPIQVII